MSIWELVILAIGLAMDAFAVAMCKGLALKRASVGQMSLVGAWFGSFQAFMPVIGYFLGVSFYDYIERFDHWIAFALLFIIGANMLRGAIFEKEEGCDGCTECADLSFGTMLVMAIATSIDALAVGISLAMAGANIWVAAILIGAITFSLSAAGVKIGSVFGSRFKKKAEFFGGCVLVLIGVKILLEHLGVISF